VKASTEETLRWASRALPPRQRAYLQERFQYARFRIAMHAVAKHAPLDVPTRSELDALVAGWANPWSARSGFLLTMLEQTLATRGGVLECGSGLSTVLLATWLAHGDRPLLALEHDPAWAALVESRLPTASRSRVRVASVRLIDYGAFTWYARPSYADGPYELVVCDGPPASTQGGRYGLLPVMARALAGDVRILLDDAHRPAESAILRRWEIEGGFSTAEFSDGAKSYALLTSQATKADAPPGTRAPNPADLRDDREATDR